MGLANLKPEQRLEQLPLASFWYEVSSEEDAISIYDRVDSEHGKNILRFLKQVPFEGLQLSLENLPVEELEQLEEKHKKYEINLEKAIKNAVNDVLKEKAPETMRIMVYPISDSCDLLHYRLDYLR